MSERTTRFKKEVLGDWDEKLRASATFLECSVVSSDGESLQHPPNVSQNESALFKPKTFTIVSLQVIKIKNSEPNFSSGTIAINCFELTRLIVDAHLNDKVIKNIPEWKEASCFLIRSYPSNVRILIR